MRHCMQLRPVSLLKNRNLGKASGFLIQGVASRREGPERSGVDIGQENHNSHKYAPDPPSAGTRPHEITSKRGCQIKRRHGRHTPPLLGVLRVACPKV